MLGRGAIVSSWPDQCAIVCQERWDEAQSLSEQARHRNETPSQRRKQDGSEERSARAGKEVLLDLGPGYSSDARIAGIVVTEIEPENKTSRP